MLASGGTLFFVSSDKVFHQLSGLLPSYGISSIYLSIVLVVGSYIRSFLYTPMYTVPSQEMDKANVDLLLELCQGVMILRNEKYKGRRKDEINLYFFCCNSAVKTICCDE